MNEGILPNNYINNNKVESNWNIILSLQKITPIILE